MAWTMSDEIVLRSKGVEISSICKVGLFEQQDRGSAGFRFLDHGLFHIHCITHIVVSANYLVTTVA